jgi:hypothetical protein
MKTTVEEPSGILITPRKDIEKFFRAIEKTGVEINYSNVAKQMGVSVSTVYDIWQNFLNRNKVEAIIKIQGRKWGVSDERKGKNS